jgi:hypothetical protein
MTLPVLRYTLERLPSSDLKDLSLKFIAMGTGMKTGEAEVFTVELAAPSVECQIYLVILATQFLLDQKTLMGEAYALSGQLVAFAQAKNRRTGDALTAQCFYYHSLAAEYLCTLPALRPKLLAAHRTAVLNHDEIGQAMCVLALLLPLRLQPGFALVFLHEFQTIGLAVPQYFCAGTLTCSCAIS